MAQTFAKNLPHPWLAQGYIFVEIQLNIWYHVNYCYNFKFHNYPQYRFTRDITINRCENGTKTQHF